MHNPTNIIALNDLKKRILLHWNKLCTMNLSHIPDLPNISSMDLIWKDLDLTCIITKHHINCVIYPLFHVIFSPFYFSIS